MSILIPFEWNPETTTIKTTSYTVPANKRARVKPLSYNFTIDTVSPMLIHSKGPTVGASGDFYLVGHLGDYHVDFTYTGGTSVTYAWTYVSGATDLVISTASANIDMALMADNTNVAASPDVSAGALYIQVTFSGAPSSMTLRLYRKELDWIWVPTGTDLDGARYLVELYPNIQ